jgi:hypothetical protein
MVGLIVVSARVASAETFIVTNTDDSGVGSLREAIELANSAAGDDTIDFALDPGATIDLISPLPNLTTNIELDNGTGASGLTVRRSTAVGTPEFRIFYVGPGSTVVIDGLTISNGGLAIPEDGGGIYNDWGTVTLNDSTVSGNRAAYNGGGIYGGRGKVTLNDSTVSGNSIRFGDGGGIYSEDLVTLTNSTVSGNSGARNGGGIYSVGFVKLTNSTVSDNRGSGDGGGIYGPVEMRDDSTVSGNSAFNGGGIANPGGRVTLDGSTVSRNYVYGNYGGGILNRGSTTLTNATVSGNVASYGGGICNWGTMTLTNSTVSGNNAISSGYGGQGGGIYNSGTLTLTNSTVSRNTSQSQYGSQGAGIFNYASNASTTTLGNTIVAGNKIFLPSGGEDPDDVYGSVSTKGHNLIGTGDGSSGLTNAQNGDQVGTDTTLIDPKLGLLAYNGGPTQTHALLPGSLAIDAGNNSLAVGPNGTALAFDQRGVGYPRIQGARVDIGAFELQNITPSDNTPPTTEATGTSGGNPYTGGEWTNKDVALALTATDEQNGSGVKEITYSVSGPGTQDIGSGATKQQTSIDLGTLTHEGITTITYHAADKAGNIEQPAKNLIVKIDKTEPQIDLMVPASDQDYVLGQSVLADYAVADTLSGIDTQNATVPSGAAIDTATVGTKTFTVTATDKVGNQATLMNSYRVIYAWSGVLQPINADGSSIFKAGSTVPIKFQLTGGSASITSAQAKLYIAKIDDNVVGTEVEAVTSTPASTGNEFRPPELAGGEYVYNWGTKGYEPGTYQLRIDLGDQTTNTVVVSLK